MAVNCKACGATDVVAGSVFCHRCGARIEPNAGSETGSLSSRLTPPAGSQSLVDQPRESGTASKGARSTPEKTAPATIPGRGKQEPERDIWTVQFSPRGMIGSWLLVGILVAGCMALPYFVTVDWIWMLLASFLIVLAQQCRYWYRRFNEKFRLTSYRLLQERGIISRTVNRVELIEIEDIQLVRTLIDRLVGIGSINVLSRDVSHPRLRIDAIDDVEKRFDELEQVMRTEKRRRELHIPQM